MLKIFKRIFYFSNTISSLKLEILKKLKNKIDYSGYFNPTIEQQEATIFFIKKILNLANQKKTILISIPSPIDISKKRNNAEKNKDIFWIDEFRKIERQENNFKFLNLIDMLPRNTENLFLECDGHLSIEGHKWISENLSEYLK